VHRTALATVPQVDARAGDGAVDALGLGDGVWVDARASFPSFPPLVEERSPPSWPIAVALSFDRDFLFELAVGQLLGSVVVVRGQTSLLRETRRSVTLWLCCRAAPMQTRA